MAKTGWVWDGTQFVALTAPVSAFPNAVLIYSTTQPDNPRTGQMWFNITDSLLYVYNGSQWKNVTSPGSTYSTTEPANPLVGQLWINSSTNTQSVWTGSIWMSVGASATDSDQNIIANQVFR